MKKYVVLISTSILVIAIILILLNFFNKTDKKTSCIDKINLEEIYEKINSLSDGLFEKVDYNFESQYSLINFSKSDYYLIARVIDNPEEYFIIIKNLDENEMSVLKSIVDKMKTKEPEKFEYLELKTYNGITYISFSPTHYQFINSIIENYIYCE